MFSGDISAHEYQQRQQKVDYQESINRMALPTSDKGKMISDVFAQRLGLEVFNPDDISLESYLEMIEDSAIQSSLHVIINMVIGREWEIVGGEPEVRDFITKMFDRLGMETVFQQVLSAFWVGFSVAEKVFAQQDDGKWFIKRYKILPPDTLTFNMFPNGQIRRVIQFGSLLGFSKTVTFLPPKVNVFTWDGGLSANFGNPYGHSVLKGIYKDWVFKDWILKFKGRFLELMAGGLIIADAGFWDPDIFHSQIKLAKSTSVITIRQGQSVKFQMPTGDGDAFLKSLVYHDKRIREGLVVPVLLLGQEGAFGSSSLGKVHFQLLTRARIQRLQQQLSRWADGDIRQISDVNFGPQETYPRFRFKLSSDEEALMRATITKLLIDAGALGEAYRKWVNDFNDLPDIMDAGIQFVKPGRAEQSPAPGGSVERGVTPDIDQQQAREAMSQIRDELDDIREGSGLSSINEEIQRIREEAGVAA